MPAAFLDVSGAAGGDALPRHVAVRGPGGARGGAGPLRGHSGAAALPQAFGRARHGKESGWLACESPSDTKDARVPRRHGRDLLQEEEGEAPQTPRGGPAEPACAGRAILICIVAMNFCSGILLVNSVKYIYAIFGFNFPLFVASSHMVFSWALTSFIVGARSEKAQLMSQAQRLHKVFPIAVLNASSIACANSALMFIYPSFHEMIQSTTPLFTLLCAVLLEGARFSSRGYATMLPLCGGTVVSSASELNFSWAGLALSAVAVLLRALKQILQGRLLCDESVDSVTLCYYMAPFNLLLFASSSVVVEGRAPLRGMYSSLGAGGDRWVGLPAAVLCSSLLACTFQIANFFMVKHLGAVGSSVVAQAKMPATIAMSVVMFGNAVTLRQLFGFALTFLGVWLFGQWGRPLRRPSAAERPGP